MRWPLADLWPWLILAFVLAFSGAIFAAIFGYIPVVSSLFSLRGSSMTGFLYALGYCVLGLLPLTFLAGFAYDSLADRCTSPTPHCD